MTRYNLHGVSVQDLVEGATPGTVEEWTKIFTELTPPAGVASTQAEQLSEVCGAQHRHLPYVWCEGRAGHPGKHYGASYCWASENSGPSLADRVAVLEEHCAHVTTSLSVLAPMFRVEALEKEVQKIKDRLRAAGN